MGKSPQRLAINSAHDVLVGILLSQGHHDLRILDVGGAASPLPTPRAKQWAKLGNVKVLDMDPKYSPDYVVDIEKGTTFEDGHFDVVLCGQLLEHTFNFIGVMQELWRITGGLCVLDVPFVYPYHEAPSDYWRFSHAAMMRLCLSVGFKKFTSRFLCGGTMTWCLATNDPEKFDIAAIAKAEDEVIGNGGRDSGRDLAGLNGGRAAQG